MTMKLRREAGMNGQKRYSTGLPCKAGHLAERYVSTGGCIECLRPAVYGPISSTTLPWFPDSPIQVPNRIRLAPDVLAVLHTKVQAFVTATCAEWLAAWEAETSDAPGAGE